MNPFKTPFQPPVSLLITPRLQIRVDSEEQYIDKFRTSADAELMAWCGFATPEELGQQQLKLAGGLSNYRTSTVFFHLTLPQTGRVIGSLAFHNWYQIHRRSELGYAMSSEAHRNMGYMREALPEVLRFGFEAMNLNRIEAFIAPDNEASRRMVGGAGFTLEGKLYQHYSHRGSFSDSMVYGLLRENWSAD